MADAGSYACRPERFRGGSLANLAHSGRYAGCLDAWRSKRGPNSNQEEIMVTNRQLTNTLDRMMTLNRALDRAFTGWNPNGMNRPWVPAMDVAEHADAYLIHMELPGVSSENVEVDFQQNVLTIRGTKPASFDASSEGEYRVYATERVSGQFERSVRLPEFIDSDNIDASFSNGVLTVHVPKAQAAKPRKIEIKG
jgi:HSP20 family protein